MNLISKETYADYLKCLDKELEDDLIGKGLAVTKKDGDLLINKVVIHLEGNPTGLIRITCLGKKKLTGQFILCNDDECIDTVMGLDSLSTYGNIVLRMDKNPIIQNLLVY